MFLLGEWSGKILPGLVSIAFVISLFIKGNDISTLHLASSTPNAVLCGCEVHLHNTAFVTEAAKAKCRVEIGVPIYLYIFCTRIDLIFISFTPSIYHQSQGLRVANQDI